jgi:quinol monooxygenase YgiN
MVIVTAKLEVQRSKLTEAINDMNELVLNTQMEEGCMRYDLYQCIENECSFFIFEEWQNENFLDKHFKSQHIRHFGESKRQWILGKIEITKLNKV